MCLLGGCGGAKDCRETPGRAEALSAAAEPVATGLEVVRVWVAEAEVFGTVEVRLLASEGVGAKLGRDLGATVEVGLRVAAVAGGVLVLEVAALEASDLVGDFAGERVPGVRMLLSLLLLSRRGPLVGPVPTLLGLLFGAGGPLLMTLLIGLEWALGLSNILPMPAARRNMP